MKEPIQLNLLLNSAALPAEGADLTPLRIEAGTSPFPSIDLARWLIEQCEASPVRFFIDPTGAITADTDEPVIELDHVVVETFMGSSEPAGFAFSSAFTRLDFEEAFRYIPDQRRYFGEEIQEEEMVRDLLNKITGVLAESARAFTQGTCLPLLRWSEGYLPGSGRAELLGLWLLTPAQEEEMRLWANQTQDVYGRWGLVMENADVEGYGLRETLASMAMLGFVLSSADPAQAETGRDFAPSQAKVESRSAVGNVDSESKPGFFRRLFSKKDKPRKRVLSEVKAHPSVLSSGVNLPTKVVVDISQQKAFLLINDQIGLETPVSTARPGKKTPRGTFKITEKVASGKISTIYKVDLPYWMRLGNSAFGLHVGDLPGYPASAGCVRVHEEAAPILFEHLKPGSTVEIRDQWSEANRKEPLAACTGI